MHVSMMTVLFLINNNISDVDVGITTNSRPYLGLIVVGGNILLNVKTHPSYADSL